MAKTYKIISWNVNGLRAVLRKNFFLEFIKKYDPDILCVQETKAEKGQVLIDLPQYTEYWHSAKKKGYSGVAIFTKEKPKSVTYGIDSERSLIDDQGRDGVAEGRVITAEYQKFYVVTVYTPNAKDDLSRLAYRYKKWDPAFLLHCNMLQKKKPVIFCGDLNVAHKEIDLARPKENMGNKGFTKEEREGFDNIVDAGFLDTLRIFYHDTPGLYTWWTHWAKARERNVGWRIDYVCASGSFKKNIKKAFILSDVMGSDHCPVGIDVQV